MKASLLSKLENLTDRHEEVSALLGDGDTIADQNRFRDLSREYAELESVVRCYGEFTKVQADLDEARTMLEDADVVMVSYGIVSRVARTALSRARAKGIKVGLLRPKMLFPFPNAKLRELAARGDVTFVSVELSNGQMRDDIRLAIGHSCPVELVSRLGGRLVTEREILDKLGEIAG